MNKEFFPPTISALPNQYQNLKQGIGVLLETGRQQAAQQVNTLLVQTYWHIGQYIVEYEQKGRIEPNTAISY